MNRKEYIEHIRNSFDEAHALMLRKSADYATDHDPFLNFKASEHIGISPERAILVRLNDKLVRVSNCLDKEVMVKDEQIKDTLLDIINYAAILRAYLAYRAQ